MRTKSTCKPSRVSPALQLSVSQAVFSSRRCGVLRTQTLVATLAVKHQRLTLTLGSGPRAGKSSFRVLNQEGVQRAFPLETFLVPAQPPRRRDPARGGDAASYPPGASRREASLPAAPNKTRSAPPPAAAAAALPAGSRLAARPAAPRRGGTGCRGTHSRPAARPLGARGPTARQPPHRAGPSDSHRAATRGRGWVGYRERLAIFSPDSGFL